MAIENVFRLDIDLIRPRYWSDFEVYQNDSIKFIIRIMKDGINFPLSDVTVASLVNKRPDGESVVKEGVITPGTNEITFTLGTTEVAIRGRVESVIQLYDAQGKRVSAQKFYYIVHEDPTGAGFTPSVTEQTLITRILNDGPNTIQGALDATTYAEEQGNIAREKALEVSTLQATLDEVLRTATLTQETLNNSVAASKTERDALTLLRNETQTVLNATQEVRTQTEQSRLETIGATQLAISTVDETSYFNNFTTVPFFQDGELVRVEEKEGAVLKKSTDITYHPDGAVNTIVDKVAGRTVISTLNYEAGEVVSISKQTLEGGL